MIFDREENLSRYMNRADAEKIYGFIRSIDEKTEKGRVKRQKIVIHFRFLPEPYEIEWTE